MSLYEKKGGGFNAKDYVMNGIVNCNTANFHNSLMEQNSEL